MRILTKTQAKDLDVFAMKSKGISVSPLFYEDFLEDKTSFFKGLFKECLCQK